VLQICVTCLREFDAKRRRSWCSDLCYRRGRARILERIKVDEPPAKPRQRSTSDAELKQRIDAARAERGREANGAYE